MSLPTVMVVFGTRPEAVKMAPVVRELQRHKDRLRTVVTVTAQHRQMLDQVLDLFQLSADHDLNIMKANQSLADVTCEVVRGLSQLLREESANYLLVQGDTTTTFSAALAAFYNRVPVGHIEAGLRTWNPDFPYPEEMNRVLTSRLSNVHFCPTQQSRENLLREGISPEKILVTGNTVIDALLSIVTTDAVAAASNGKRKVLVTAHRRESFGTPLQQVCLAIQDLCARFENLEVLFPVHPNPNVRETVHRLLGGHAQIRLTEPLDYLAFSRELASSFLILTDSGGVQEEAPSLGKPVLVLRNETERMEGVHAGTCRLVGTDRQKIVEQATLLLTDDAAYQAMANAVNPYGDGHASARIVDWLLRELTTQAT